MRSGHRAILLAAGALLVPAAPAAALDERDTTPPELSLSLTVRGFALAPEATPVAAKVRGTVINYTLSEDATVRFAIRRVRSRRRSRLVGTLTRAGIAGDNSLPFSGRIGRRPLPVGAYRLVARATDAEGNRSRSRRVSFYIAHW
jgi:hypothetical protein